MEKLESCVDQLVAEGKKVSFTGHSSGGSMAVIAAEILEQKYPGAIKRIVTFGQPATGYWNFKRRYSLKAKTYRICCDVDMVTFLPVFPSHSGMWENCSGSTTTGFITICRLWFESCVY